MNPRSLEVSVVVCAYTEDRWADLVEAVASVQRQAVPPAQIIVVSDHNPSLAARIHDAMPAVVLVENREQQGLSGARNSGIVAATGDVVAFLDDDAVAAPDWLARLVAAYDDPRVKGVGGSIEPLWLDRRPAWFPEEFAWVVGCTYLGMPTERAQVRNLIGANMSLRREVFADVGAFRSGIGRVGTRPVGCEETELCIRVGHRWPDSLLLYEPRASVRHRVPASRATWRYFKARCYSEGLSKALVAREVGQRAALSTERAYATRVLPRGAVVALARAVSLRDVSGGVRAVAIAAGLTYTTVGYVQAKLAMAITRRWPSMAGGFERGRGDERRRAKPSRGVS